MQFYISCCSRDRQGTLLTHSLATAIEFIRQRLHHAFAVLVEIKGEQSRENFEVLMRVARHIAKRTPHTQLLRTHTVGPSRSPIASFLLRIPCQDSLP